LYCIKLAGSELHTHTSLQLQFNRIKETDIPIKSRNLPQFLILIIKLSLLVFNIFCRLSGSGDTEKLAV
jgi:hypothetical protein